MLQSHVLIALEPPSRPQARVNDYAGMLSIATRDKLETTLKSFEEATTNQIVVATFPSLEADTLEDFSIRLAEQWKIGQKGRENGVILLIFKAEREVRIEVGYGLEGVLTDALSKFIIEREIVPHFRQGEYDKGVENAVEAMIAVTRGEYQAESLTETDMNSEALFAEIVLSIVIAQFFPLLILQILFALGSFGIAWSFLVGSALFALHCLVLGNAPLIIYLLSRGLSNEPAIFSGQGMHRGRSFRRGFGGGFGGGFRGGGGGFGGGGASGRW